MPNALKVHPNIGNAYVSSYSVGKNCEAVILWKHNWEFDQAGRFSSHDKVIQYYRSEYPTLIPLTESAFGEELLIRRRLLVFGKQLYKAVIYLNGEEKDGRLLYVTPLPYYMANTLESAFGGYTSSPRRTFFEDSKDSLDLLELDIDKSAEITAPLQTNYKIVVTRVGV